MPSNISRSKSIKQRISHYLSKRINGEPETPTNHNQGNFSEQTFSDFGQVLNAAVRQSRPPKLGLRQRFMAEFNAALDSRETVQRSSTTRHHRHHRSLKRSATTPSRRHKPEHSSLRDSSLRDSSLRDSSSLSRGRRHHREDSSTRHRQLHRKNSSHPPSPSVAREHAPQPLSRAGSYRATSFDTKPIISKPLTVVDLYEHPALRKDAYIPLTDRIDSLNFDIPPTLRKQPKVPEPPPINQMPLHRRAASNGSRPAAPRGTDKQSVMSTSTRWGDFMSSNAISDQAANASPRQPHSRGRSHGRSQSPAKFPSFSPAAHQARAESPLARTPVTRKPVAEPNSPRTRQARGPVICELCRGLSDPNISYSEVKRHLCSNCARKAFGEPGREPGRESNGSSRERSGEPSKSTPPLLSRPPTLPVKDFAGFNFAGPSVNPATPSSTGSQPKFEALSTATPAQEPFDTYAASPTNTRSHHVRRPRPPSSEYSAAPAASKYGSSTRNPYASTMGNPFLSSNPLTKAIEARHANNTAGAATPAPPPPPPLPRLRTNHPVSGVESYMTVSPHNHTHPFIPFLPATSTIPERYKSDSGGEHDWDRDQEKDWDSGDHDWEQEKDDSPTPVNRRSSFYHFYDEVLDTGKRAGDRHTGKGKGKE